MTEITSLSTALADRYKLERHLGEGAEASVLAETQHSKRTRETSAQIRCQRWDARLFLCGKMARDVGRGVTRGRRHRLTPQADHSKPPTLDRERAADAPARSAHAERVPSPGLGRVRENWLCSLAAQFRDGFPPSVTAYSSKAWFTGTNRATRSTSSRSWLSSGGAVSSEKHRK